MQRFRVSMQARACVRLCVCVGWCVGAETRREIGRGGRDVEWEKQRGKNGG